MTAPVLLVLVYVYLAVAVALLGRRTRLGFWRSLRLALLATPVIALVVLFFGYEARVGKLRGEEAAESRQASQQ